MINDQGDLVAQVRQYYEDKLGAFGATPRGVDWNSRESQELRFEQLLKVCRSTEGFSINDFGCGYGALAEYMIRRGYLCDYFGYDVSEKMIETAKRKAPHSERTCCFVSDAALFSPADYTVASGVFNVRLDFSDSEWEEYVLATLSKLADLSKEGFAFNMLTQYSDRHLMRPDLYYANSSFFFDFCKRNFSRFVSLLHDYPLYEFTILVRN